MNNSRQIFNPQQWEAITTLEGAVLVLAGAGSGKTRVVTSRIIHLIENGVPPSAILGLTFTNKAALEMKQRVTQMTSQTVCLGTFHSLGVRILRETISNLGYPDHFSIYDEEDSLKLLKAALADLSMQDEKCDIKALRQLISHYKNSLFDEDKCEGFSQKRSFSEIYACYMRKLKESGGVDFDDLLVLPVKIWQSHPDILESYQERWPYILIDEYQDTNTVQCIFLRLLAKKRGNIFAVGDPDQSIYSWRGANIGNILNFENDFPGAKIIRLEQNYRSSMNILKAANALIKNNISRYQKELWSHLGEGEKIKLYVSEDEGGEAHYVCSQIEQHRKAKISLNEMAVFFRTHAQSRAFEDKLISKGIPYKIVGGISFYQRREIKDILAFLHLAISSQDVISFARTLNIPKRGMGGTTLEKLMTAASQEQLPIIAYCTAIVEQKTLQHNVRLTIKQKEALKEYLLVINVIRSLLSKGSLRDLVMMAVEKSHYLDYLKDDQESFKERKENIDSLIAKAMEWDASEKTKTLETFLEDVALKSNVDEENENQEYLSLMTLHHGKGLEFEVTFLVGLEENLFPHVNAKENEADIEEERRLCYVGMTRAKKYLYLSRCKKRFLWGTTRTQFPSRFLKEIPPHFLEKGVNSYGTSCVTYDLPKPACRDVQPFQIGEKLFHKEFGLGQVKEVYEDSMGVLYKIFFIKDQKERTLVGKYATLVRV